MGVSGDLPRLVSLPNEEATLALGALIASSVESGVFYLSGELGAGKTTLVRGFLRALGYEGSVKSPTYTLIEPYEIGGIRIAHLDLYRIKDGEELMYIGLEDAVEDADFTFIEWPEKGEDALPHPNVRISFEINDEQRLALINERFSDS